MMIRIFATFLIAAITCHATTLKNPFGILTDEFSEPPDPRRFSSPNRMYEFVVSLGGGPFGDAEMTNIAPPQRKKLWKIKLKQKYGPKFVVLTDAGTVVMLDEWRNVTTPSAIEIRNVRGSLMRRYSTEAVVKTTHQTLDAVAAKAKPGLGWWLSGEPRLAADGATVVAPTAGGHLKINTRDATIVFRD